MEFERQREAMAGGAQYGGGIAPATGTALCGPVLSGEKLAMVFLVLAGACMQGYAHGTRDAFLVAVILLLGGGAMARLVFGDARPELRAFHLTFAVCIFVGGLAQCYSAAVFGATQSTGDSAAFLEQISPAPPFMTMAQMPLFNSPLAILVWQQVFKVTWWLGLDFGSYVAVMFNAFVMAITSAVTVRTARELFGDDAWRLRRVGTLFAFCGLFILFGAVLIRDCFTTFLNTMVLWGIIRWQVRRTQRELYLALAITGLAAFAMVYLRLQAVVSFGAYWLLVLLFWFFAKKLDVRRLLVALLLAGTAAVASPYISQYMEMSKAIQARGLKSYTELAANENPADSLGMRLVVSQPLPVRMVMGSGTLMINPIPLWVNFQVNSGTPDYFWIKGYHGLYQVLVLPLVFSGILILCRQVKRDRVQAGPMLFLVVYLLMNMLAVTSTSLEQRHIAQFMPAFMILAVLPDTRVAGTSLELRRITRWWLALVVLVHLAWATMKG